MVKGDFSFYTKFSVMYEPEWDPFSPPCVMTLELGHCLQYFSVSPCLMWAGQRTQSNSAPNTADLCHKCRSHGQVCLLTLHLKASSKNRLKQDITSRKLKIREDRTSAPFCSLKTEKLNCLWSTEGREDTFGKGRNKITDHSLKH